jgi:hypothetical protein
VFSLRPDEAEIMTGTLDNAPTGLTPTYELWVARREEWLHGLPWAEQYTADRTGETDHIV